MLSGMNTGGVRGKLKWTVVRRRATELARTGLYQNCQEVVEALVAEGFEVAPKALAGKFWWDGVESNCARYYAQRMSDA